MMPKPRTFAVGALLAMFAGACGDTTRNSGSPETPGTDSTVTGSGGSSTNGTTSAATNSATNGTGGTTMTLCPSFEPAEGSSCADESQVCGFENCQAPDYRDSHELTCINGAWTLTLTIACPFEGCPAVPPLVGQGCDASVTPGPCVAVDACGAAYDAFCSGGVWQTTDDQDAERPGASATSGGGGTGSDPIAPVCPVYPPYFGEPCCPALVPETCDYSESGTAGAAGASFIVIPETNSTGGGAVPPIQGCAVCTDQMFWDSCPVEE